MNDGMTQHSRRVAAPILAIASALLGLTMSPSHASAVSLGTIGHYVWWDLNGNGIQDKDLPAVGVRVDLLNASSVQVDTTLSDIAGHYAFSAPAGDYIVRFEIPSGSVVTKQRTDITDGSAPSETTGLTALFHLNAGEVVNDIDGGMVPQTVGNRVWDDTNFNGIQDPGEPGLVGLSVNVVNIGADLIAGTADDWVFDTQVTAEYGLWDSQGLPTGSYYLEVTPPPGYVRTVTTSTSANALNGEELDSNATTASPNGAAVRSSVFAFTPNTHPITEVEDGDQPPFVKRQSDYTIDLGLARASDGRVYAAFGPVDGNNELDLNFVASVSPTCFGMPCPAVALSAARVLPADLEYISMSGPGTYDPLTNIWTAPSAPVSAGTSFSVTVHARVSASSGTIPMTIGASLPIFDVDRANDQRPLIALTDPNATATPEPINLGPSLAVVSSDLPLTAYTAITPSRLTDTRSDFGFTRITPDTIRVQVAGRFQVPANAAAATLVVTATGSSGAGFLTVYPAGEVRPETSNLNVPAQGATIANSATVKLSADGFVDVYTSTATQIIVDIFGSYAPSGPTSAGRFKALAPSRLVDTRNSTKVVGHGILNVPRPMIVPPEAQAVAVNLTVTDATEPGYFTMWAAGSQQPGTSTGNVDKTGQTRAIFAVVPVSAAGISVYSSSGSHVIVDLVGYFTGASSAATIDGLFQPTSPQRLIDTRRGAGVLALSTGGTLSLQSPSVASASWLQVTSADAPDAGFLTAYPAGTALPSTSTVNTPGSGGAASNAAVTGSTKAGFAFRSNGGENVIVDSFGAYVGVPLHS